MERAHPRQEGGLPARGLEWAVEDAETAPWSVSRWAPGFASVSLVVYQEEVVREESPHPGLAGDADPEGRHRPRLA